MKVRVTDSKYRTIMENCIKSGRTISELLREYACEKEIIVLGGIRELLTELRRQGNNLNQMTMLARQGRIDFVIKSLLSLHHAPNLNAIFDKPLHDERCFIIFTAETVKHEHQQNIKAAKQGLSLYFLYGITILSGHFKARYAFWGKLPDNLPSFVLINFMAA